MEAGNPPSPTLVDIADSWEEAHLLSRSPLVVRTGLQAALGTAELPAVERLDAGHSNPTFVVRANGSRWILRRPPRPPFAQGAHDVLREYRVLKALRGRVRVPTPVLSCDDHSVIGAPFYLMEWLDGHVLRDRLPPSLDRDRERKRVGRELIDALVELHAVEPAAFGVADPGRGASYLERQVTLWERQWLSGRTRSIPVIDEVTRRLRSDIPVSSSTSIVHGDFKLDNVMFAADAPTRILAILDWEMATVGDPLADVGFLTATWIEPGESRGRIAGLATVTDQPGFARRGELAERYAHLSGVDLDRLGWYQALALWKLAILFEGSYRRFLSGTTADEFLGSLGEAVPCVAEHSLRALNGELL